MGQETYLAHLELAASICGLIIIPIIAMWWDIRKEARRVAERQLEQHTENQKWMTKMDTKLSVMVEPMFQWWIKKINGGGHE